MLHDLENTPVYINNRNRYSMLKKLVDWLEQLNNIEIIIIDNDSTYKPLLSYYKTIPHQIIYLNENIGNRSIFLDKVYSSIRSRHFVYTDPDVLPIEECPLDVIPKLINVLKANSSIAKVGLSLEIFDIPDCYRFKQDVIDWESRFWQKKDSNGNYTANVDTTFAVYDKTRLHYLKNNFVSKSLRMDYPYVARHLPWYIDSANLDAEELFYMRHSNLTTSQSKNTKTFWSGHKFATGLPIKIL